MHDNLKPTMQIVEVHLAQVANKIFYVYKWRLYVAESNVSAVKKWTVLRL